MSNSIPTCLEKPSKETDGLLGEKLWIFDGIFVAEALDGEVAAHHVEGEGPEAPEIRGAAMTEVMVDFRGHVVEGAASRHAFVDVGRLYLVEMS